MRVLSVAPRASGLLVIGLDAAGHFKMGDEADVGTVNAHAKGIGGDGDGDFATHEPFLCGGAGRIVHAAMVGDAVAGGERLVHALDTFARGAINDARAVFAHDGADALDFCGKKRVAAARKIGRDGVDGEMEVFSRKPRDEQRGVAQCQLRHDVGAHIRGCRCRECHDGRASDAFERTGEPQIVGAEVMPPLGEAVRLVHGKKRHAHPGEHVCEITAAETLGRDVNEPELARADAPENLALLIRTLRTVYHPRRDAARDKRVHLILHQRDERRDHHGDIRQEHCRQD